MESKQRERNDHRKDIQQGLIKERKDKASERAREKEREKERQSESEVGRGEGKREEESKIGHCVEGESASERSDKCEMNEK